jgi:F-type H+-transporting ATPase subunit b
MFILADIISTGLILASEKPAESNGIFSGTLGDSIWTIVWFVILLIVLKKFAWKHILAGLQAREDKITSEIGDAQKMRKEAEGKLGEYNKKLSELDAEGAELARKHLNKAEAQAKLMIDKTIAENRSAKQRAQMEIELAMVQAKNELLGQVGDIVLGLGNEILGRTVSDEDNQKLIDDAVEKLRE